MTKFLSHGLAFSLVFAAFGCGGADETRTADSSVPANAASLSKTPTPLRSEQTIPIDIAEIAEKSSVELDEIFGAAQEASATERGEFRLYKIAGQSKGLAVRFYGDRAKSFNLIADAPFPTSKEALKRIFKIDVGNSPPLKDAKEPLTESYQGTFGGVKFKKVSAKRQESGKGFIFVLAELAQ